MCLCQGVGRWERVGRERGRTRRKRCINREGEEVVDEHWQFPNLPLLYSVPPQLETLHTVANLDSNHFSKEKKDPNIMFIQYHFACFSISFTEESCASSPISSAISCLHPHLNHFVKQPGFIRQIKGVCWCIFPKTFNGTNGSPSQETTSEKYTGRK